MALSDHLLSLLVPITILLHLWVSPYSKVEESFNLQATHDILRYGIPKVSSPDLTETLKAEYDHFSFPGAVPRSFVGALVLAGFSKPFISTFGGLVNEQVIVRGVLGLLNSLAILSYRRTASRGYGRGTANWYLLLQCSQFHVMYYASRTLPNMFAFGLSTIALQQFLPVPIGNIGRRSASYRLGIYFMGFAGVIFRSEIALYLGIQVLYLLLQGRISLIRDIIPSGIAGGLVGLLTTISVDSYFWQTYSKSLQPPIFSTPFLTSKFGLIWPEFSAFHYNALQNNSSAWGTSPWHTYFTSSLPKLIMNPFALAVLLPLTVSQPGMKKGARDILVPILGYVAGYSGLPHKEWRFIIYVMPGLTLVAALGANWIWNRRSRSAIYALLSLGLVSSILATYAGSFGMLLISSLNYPGGEALNVLHTHLAHQTTLLPQNTTITIHLDVPVCMTGATRFLQEAPLFPAPETKIAPYQIPHRKYTFDKTENADTLLNPLFWTSIDYTLSSRGPEHVIGKWEVLTTIKGYRGIKIYSPGEKTDGGFHAQFKPFGIEVGSWWGMLEKEAREQYLQGMWVDVAMEDMVWILKKDGPIGRVDGGERGVGTIEEEHW